MRGRGANAWRILLAVAVLAAIWQLAALAAAASGPSAARLAPTWRHIFMVDLPGFAAFATGADDSDYRVAFAVIGANTLATVIRVVVSIVLAFLIGTTLGLITMSSRYSYDMISPVLRVIRNIPLLALVPLFLIWFGGEEYGIIAFITFGLSMIYLTSTISAIATVDRNRIAFASMLGAGRATLVWDVILPSIVPNLLDATRVAVGVAFAVGLGGEFLAAQEGLGRLLIVSETYVQTGRMVIVLLCYILLASIAARIVDSIGNRLTRWLPRSRQGAAAV
jgi:ABC-type nitrate/sulfonate/bicarbonate transport system permease component